MRDNTQSVASPVNATDPVPVLQTTEPTTTTRITVARECPEHYPNRSGACRACAYFEGYRSAERQAERIIDALQQRLAVRARETGADQLTDELIVEAVRRVRDTTTDLPVREGIADPVPDSRESSRTGRDTTTCDACGRTPESSPPCVCPPPRDTTTNKTNCELCMEAGIAEERARIERIAKRVWDCDCETDLQCGRCEFLAAIREGDDA
jgi:hypothetical protein